MPPTGNAAHDDRLDPGMQRLRALVLALESDGATQTGWKAGFGAVVWRERFDLHAPLVGALLDRTRLADGSTVAIGDWQAARAEAEIAVLLGTDVPPDAPPEQAVAAISALAPAIELIDLHPVPESPDEALSGNIFHRHWITGDFTPAPEAGDLSGLVADVRAMGEELGPVEDVEAPTGAAGVTLAEVARIGARHGRPLVRGDIVILGSVVPPAPVAPGGAFRLALHGHAPIEVHFTA